MAKRKLNQNSNPRHKPQTQRYFQQDLQLDMTQWNMEQDGMNHEQDCQKRQKIEPVSDVNNQISEYIISLATGYDDLNPDEKVTLSRRCVEECQNQNLLPILYSREFCQAMEKLCMNSTEFSLFFLKNLMKNKRQNIRMVLSKNFASRCVEKAIYALQDKQAEEQSTSKYSPEAEGLIQDFCECLVEDLDHLCNEYGGSHILRCLGRILCGLTDPAIQKAYNFAQKNYMDSSSGFAKRLTLRPIFRQCMDSLCNFLLDWEYVNCYLVCEPMSLLVQDFLDLASNLDNSTHFYKMFDDFLAADNSKILDGVFSKFASRFYEKLVAVCPGEELFEKILNKHFKSKLGAMAKNRFGNFVVQRILEKCPNEEMANDIIDELMPSIDALWDQKFFGVIVSLVKMTAKHDCMQAEILDVICQKLGCQTTDDRVHLVPLILQLQNLQSLTLEQNAVPVISEKIQIQGSLLGQQLVKFTKASEFLVPSILALSQNTLMELLRHPMASRFVEAFFNSSAITEDCKLQLFGKLKNNSHKLASDKCGSRILELLWFSKWINAKLRNDMAINLVKKYQTLQNSIYGKILWQKFSLNFFKSDKKKWDAILKTV